MGSTGAVCPHWSGIRLAASFAALIILSTGCGGNGGGSGNNNVLADAAPDAVVVVDASGQDAGDPGCGNGSCEATESAHSCPDDCPAMCGDSACTHNETPADCPDDCPPECGDGACTHGENVLGCPGDCQAQCGDSACTHTENAADCPGDCPAQCGDAHCTHSETAATCPGDCPVSCGDGACTHAETASTCPGDCPVSCGDGACTHAETASTCPGDCPAQCGDGACTHSETAATCGVDCASVVISSPSDGAHLGLAVDLDPGPGYAIEVCLQTTLVGAGESVLLDLDGTLAATVVATPPTTCVTVAVTEGTHTLRGWIDLDSDTVADDEHTITIHVDLTRPDTVSNLQVTVLDRRSSSLRLTWSAPANESTVAHEVRWSHDPIVTVADFTAAHDVPWTGGSSVAGGAAAKDVNRLAIEREYYVAVRGVDSAGNAGDIESSAVAVRPAFNYQLTQAGTSALGMSGSAVGDLDGDGADDLVVGSFVGGNIYFGPLPANSAWVPDVTFAPGDPITVAGIGDFNGDGYDDLALGAPYAASFSGEVYIYFGGPAAAWTSTMPSASADVVLTGIESSGVLGYHASPAGDFCGSGVGGDGFFDLVVSAPNANGGRGYAYVICGQDLAPGFVGFIDDPSLDVLRIDGVNPSGAFSDSFGWRMAALGDINGDGYDDLGIADPIPGAGSVHVVRGMALATIAASSPVVVTNTTYMQTLSGANAADQFGRGLAGAGDLDGDGLADLVVGAPSHDGHALDAGGLFVYLSNGSWLDTAGVDVVPNTLGFAGDQLGYAVAQGGAGLAGQADRSVGHAGDGVAAADLIAVSHLTAGGVGEIFALFGGSAVLIPGGQVLTSAFADDPATSESQDGLGFVLGGDAGLSRHHSVWLAGDLNGDGYEDFVIADPEWNSWTGRVVVVY